MLHSCCELDVLRKGVQRGKHNFDDILGKYNDDVLMRFVGSLFYFKIYS